jgi:hypothetical protein
VVLIGLTTQLLQQAGKLPVLSDDVTATTLLSLELRFHVTEL